MSEKAWPDRLDDYIEYAEATKKFADAGFYRDLRDVLMSSYSEAQHDQAIKEAVEKVCKEQREASWQAVVDSKQHMKANHLDYTKLREAILNATIKGESK